MVHRSLFQWSTSLWQQGSPAHGTPQRKAPSERTSAEGPSQILVVLHVGLQGLNGLGVRNLDETGKHVVCLCFSRDVPYLSCYENQ